MERQKMKYKYIIEIPAIVQYSKMSTRKCTVHCTLYSMHHQTTGYLQLLPFNPHCFLFSAHKSEQ